MNTTRPFIILICVLLLSHFSVSAQSSTYFYAGSKSLAVKDSQETKYVYQDSLGSDMQTKYLPFGQIIQQGERFGFTGNEQDSSGLHHFVARTYDSSIGRFTSVDSVLSEPAFQYAHNRPLVLVDPLGTEAFTPHSQGEHLQRGIDALNTMIGAPVFFSQPVDDGFIMGYDSQVMAREGDMQALSIYTIFKTIIDAEQSFTFYFARVPVTYSFAYARGVKVGVEGELPNSLYSNGEPSVFAQIFVHEVKHLYDLSQDHYPSEQSAIRTENLASSLLNKHTGTNFGSREYYDVLSIQGVKRTGFVNYEITTNFFAFTPRVFDMAKISVQKKLEQQGVGHVGLENEIQEAIDVLFEWQDSKAFPNEFRRVRNP